MFVFYDLFYIFAAFFYLLLIGHKSIRRLRQHANFKMRFGFIPTTIYQTIDEKDNIWVHAVSVGEVLAVLVLVKKLREAFPQYQIVLSTTTPAGYELAQAQMAKNDVVIFAPLDFSFIVRRFVKMIDPKVYISAETEIWPNLFTALADKKIPIVEVNGRISERSFRNYQWVQFLLQPVLRKVTVFCMQSPADAQRVKELGVAPEKISVVGNMKLDEMPETTPSGPPNAIESVLAKFNKSQAMVWIAGSTHPGEEKIILETFRMLNQDFPSLRLIIAPRHVERAVEVVSLVKEQGLTPQLFSQAMKTGINPDAVTVVDTIGHLRGLYRLATVVFVGKSLVGEGGQNIIEPAFFAKPIVVGPNMQNFRSIMVMLEEAQAIVQIKDAQELPSAVRQLLQNPQRRQTIGQSAQKVIQKNQGATAKTFQIISDLLS